MRVAFEVGEEEEGEKRCISFLFFQISVFANG